MSSEANVVIVYQIAQELGGESTELTGILSGYLSLILAASA